MDVEQVFKALADHHRRHLLDVLSTRDGQSLNELCTHLPMSRIGVMKHLRILEQAGLITTRKVGRERLHYLNPDPIRSVAEWAERYRRHWDERMDRLELYLREIQQEQDEATVSNAAQADSQVEEQSTGHRTDHSTGQAPESERKQDDNR